MASGFSYIDRSAISDERTNTMQIILADAKIMRANIEGIKIPLSSTPMFQEEATVIANEMARFSVPDIDRLFHCSTAIAMENQQRFLSFNVGDKVPAILAFYGQAYKYLQAEDFSTHDFAFAQKHLSIMSFLYGIIRPLDAIRLYRMPANVKLSYTEGVPLQTWWRSRMTDALINKVKADDGILLDLATTEFERMCNWKRVEREVKVIKPLFLVDKGIEFKTVVMYAKGCRGAMARFAIKNRLTSPDSLKVFTVDDFKFRSDLGDELHPHFIRME